MELDLTIVLHREKHQPKTETLTPVNCYPMTKNNQHGTNKTGKQKPRLTYLTGNQSRFKRPHGIEK